VVEQYQLGYVAELDVAAITSTLEHCLDHPQTTKEMGDRARQLVRQQYTWERNASNLSKVYTAIL